jgi:sugar lactone lactonase YvrE
MKRAVYMVAVLVLGGCAKLTDFPEGVIPAGRGRLVLNLDGGTGSRTALPGAGQFDRYVLSFSGPVSQGDAEFTAAAGNVDLPAGTWTISVAAYKGAVLSGTGSGGVTISLGAVSSLTILITGMNTAAGVQGTLKYRVNFPPAGADHSYTSTRTLTVTTPEGLTAAGPVTVTNGVEGTLGLDAGVYSVTADIRNTEQRTGVRKTASVHIYGGIETVLDLTIAEEEFTAYLPVSGTVVFNFTEPGGVSDRRIRFFSGEDCSAEIGTAVSVGPTGGPFSISVPTRSGDLYIRPELLISGTWTAGSPTSLGMPGYPAAAYNVVVPVDLADDFTAKVDTLAGQGGTDEFAEGTGTAARFKNPYGIVADGTGNLYVADCYNYRIRKIVIATGAVSTLAGNGGSGFADGTGTAAEFCLPIGLALAGGDLYVADSQNNRIRKIVIATGEVSTLAGGGGSGVTGSYLEGTGTAARFDNPRGIAADGAGNLYVADTNNRRIRKIVIATGVVSTLAGDGTTPDWQDGTFTLGTAKFRYPTGLVWYGGYLYVVDYGNTRIRRIDIGADQVTTPFGGNTGFREGTGTYAQFDRPNGIAADGGNFYVADTGNNRIRKIDIATEAVTTLSGGGTTVRYLDGIITAARFYRPQGVAPYGGYLYVADEGNHCIRRIPL